MFDDTTTKLIERTITILNDPYERITELGMRACSGCSALTSVNLPVAISIDDYAFTSCTSLTTVDLAVASSLGNKVFNTDSNLNTLILRKSDGICTAGTTVLNLTAIASGSGYIYVPSALVNTYKSASNWSTYSARFRALESYTADGTITGALDPSKI